MSFMSSNVALTCMSLGWNNNAADHPIASAFLSLSNKASTFLKHDPPGQANRAALSVLPRPCMTGC